MHAVLTLSASLLLTGLLPAQSLIVVDEAGGRGSDFTDLPAAVAAARSGDHVLVRDGSYTGFALDGRSVEVEAESSATLSGTVTLTNLPADGVIVLRGLTLQGGQGPALDLGACAGAVLVQECVLISAVDTVLVTDCDSVTFVRSFVSGGSGTGAGETGCSGLVAHESFVSIHGGSFRGGDGGPSDCLALDLDGGSGGDGARIEDTFLFSGAPDWIGGFGGDGCENAALGCQEGGPGGHGLVLAGTASALELGGGSLVGGPGGNGEGCCCIGGAEGHGWVGDVGFLGQDPRLLEVFSPVQARTVTILSLFGEEGDSALVAVGDLGPGTFLPGLNGVLGIPDPLLVFAVGPTPGHVTLPAAVPDIFPAPFVRVAVQALFLTASGDKVLSGVSRLTILP